MAARPILLIACSVLTAHASPRSDPTAGRAVFTGATEANEGSISLNPAALEPAKHDEVTLAVAGILEQLGVDRKLIDDTGALVAGPKVRDNEVGGGAQIAGLWHPGQGAALGAELRLPPPELFPSDPRLGYHSLGSRQYNYIASAGVSLKIGNPFYFGFGISHDQTFLRLKFLRDTALDTGRHDCGGTPCGFENPVAAEHYDVEARSGYVSTDNLKLNIGILLHFGKNLWIGVAYHNTPGFGIQTELDGHVDVRRAPRDGGVLLHGESTVYVSYPASVDGEVRTRVLPDLDLHVGGRWEDLSRMQSYDVRTYGIALLGQGIPEAQLRPRGFHDAVALWAGVEQVELEAAKRVRLGARLGFETSALQPDRTSPGNVSPTSVTVDVGMKLRISRNYRVRMSYGLQYFPRVQTHASQYDPRDALACEASGFDYSTAACGDLRNGYAIPTAEGTYTRIQHALSVALTHEFP